MSRAAPGQAKQLLLALLGVTVLLVVSDYLLTPDHSRRNLEFFPDMAYSPASKAQSLNTLFPDGLTQQPLVAGVVPRGSLGPRFEATEEGAKLAGTSMANPFAADDAAAVERGRELYGIYCVVCHDPAGNGKGTVVARGGTPPPSFLAVRAMDLPDGHLYHILTYGQGNMASYAPQIEPDDRWKVILHVRSLQKGEDK